MRLLSRVRSSIPGPGPGVFSPGWTSPPKLMIRTGRRCQPQMTVVSPNLWESWSTLHSSTSRALHVSTLTHTVGSSAAASSLSNFQMQLSVLSTDVYLDNILPSPYKSEKKYIYFLQFKTVRENHGIVTGKFLMSAIPTRDGISDAKVSKSRIVVDGMPGHFVSN